MHSFRDNKGNSWNIEINTWSVEQVRSRIGLDPLAIVHDSKVGVALADPVTLCGTLWVLLEEQAAAQDIDHRKFAEAMTGDAIGEATKALLDGVTDFFLSDRREAVRKLIAVGEQVRVQQLAKLNEILDRPDLVEMALQSTPSSSAIGSPASSASIQAG